MSRELPSRRRAFSVWFASCVLAACATSGTLEEETDGGGNRSEVDAAADASRTSSTSSSSSSSSSSGGSSSSSSSGSSSGGECSLDAAAYTRLLLLAEGETATLGVTAQEQVKRSRSSGNNSGDCPSSTVDENQFGVILELSNPDSVAHEIDLWVTPLHGPANDRVLFVYEDAPPVDDASTKACNEANDACVVGGDIPGADACLQGLTIPPCTTWWLLVIDFAERAEATDFEVHVETLP